MNIGIFGGSFDPPHNGHVSMVKRVMDAIRFDKFYVIPVGHPSHREPNTASGNDRLEMCKLAFDELPVTVSDIEIIEDKLSYTYDTLMKMKEKYGKNVSYYEVIGEDSLAYLDKWKNYELLLDECIFVVLKRQGYQGTIKHKNIITVESPYYLYSSTEIRNMIKTNQDISHAVPTSVCEYIEKHKLYK